MKYLAWLVGLAWLLSTTWLHSIQRSDFTSLWGVYTLSFAAYGWLVFSRHPISLKHGLYLALLGRIVSFFFDPLLSDDYYRYIWDGMLSGNGIHPMAYTPAYLIQHPGNLKFDLHLYGLMNSQGYYSVYPPLAQILFAASYFFNGLNIHGHVIFYKIILIATDFIIIFLLYQLLKIKGSQSSRVLLYALNPLILIEFAGNLHLDGLLIAGVLGATLLLEKNKPVWATSLMTFSIISKLVSLMLIPFMTVRKHWKNIVLFTVLTLAWTSLAFIFYFGKHTGWIESVRLWFFTFEFNASIYYILRWIGFNIKGYNIIQTLGPAIAIVTFAGLIVIWIKYMRSQDWGWPTAMLTAITFYYVMSTTVHPWYLGLLLALSVVSLHTYPVVWTYLVFLSYSHYEGDLQKENYYFIAAEYLLLFAWVMWERVYRK